MLKNSLSKFPRVQFISTVLIVAALIFSIVYAIVLAEKNGNSENISFRRTPYKYRGNAISGQVKTFKDTSSVFVKDNSLNFKSARVEDVLEGIKQYFLVEIVCEKKKFVGRYSGVVSLNTDIKQVVEILSICGIPVEYINKKIVVK